MLGLARGSTRITAIMVVCVGLIATAARSQSFSTLHAFSSAHGDGLKPSAPLVEAADGMLYGTTPYGGAGGRGTVYRISPDGSATVVHSFSGSDGAYPEAGLTQASDGGLYGVTSAGGASGNGAVFHITTSGTLAIMHSFSSSAAEGSSPVGAVSLGSDGALYGTTQLGGAFGSGTVFRLTTTGAFSTLHAFTAIPNGTNADGAYPLAGLTEGANGALYGTASDGGASGSGTVFSVTPTGTFATIYSFSADRYGLNTDGANPCGNLALVADGSLYGVTLNGGANGRGVIFRITPQGTMSLAHTFSQLNLNANGIGVNAEGASPVSGLIVAADGNLYGTAPQGGVNGWGTALCMDPQGTVTVLHSFYAENSMYANADGAKPQSSLMQASDGNLYGTASTAGAHGYGSVFRINPSGPPNAPSDFNGDGRTDLVLQSAATGGLAVWYMNGTGMPGGALITPLESAGWTCVGSGDFTGSGHPDLLFQNPSTGQLAYWLMDGVVATAGAYITPSPTAGWSVVATADFNGDGFPDLVLQNRSTGAACVWLMCGVTPIAQVPLSQPVQPGWVIVGAGDFNADGNPDLVLQNPTSGKLAVWYMSGTNVTGGAYVTPGQAPGWTCVSVIALTTSGHSDLVFQNRTTGQLAYWILQGVGASAGGLLPTAPPSGWQVAGPH